MMSVKPPVVTQGFRISILEIPLFDHLISFLSGSPPIAARRQHIEQLTAILNSSENYCRELWNKLLRSEKQVEAKYAGNEQRLQKIVDLAKGERRKLFSCALPPAEVERQLLYINDACRRAECKVKEQRDAMLCQRRRNKAVLARLIRLHVRLNRQIQREHQALLAETSLLGCLRRLWNATTNVILARAIGNILFRRHDRH